MSYCRWSSNSFRCDVYVYESPDGFVTHVACTRAVLPDNAQAPSLRLLVDGNARQWLVETRAFDALLHAARKVAIDHPEAGETFVHDTAGECAGNLERLAAQGFRVPASVIDDLRAEQADTDNNPTNERRS